ncbi:MAG: hypothetical protein C4575_06900 [Desulforudis sp.]|nr:MAG: hypothetical protein C4575_06900 [Desulforudis sp.]
MINLVTSNKPNLLTGLRSGRDDTLGYCVTGAKTPPGDRRGLTHPVNCAEHGKPVHPPKGKRTARDAVGRAGKGTRRKRTPSCNETDRG